MRVYQGQIVKANGKVLQVMRRAGSLSDQWRCDDGWVYDEVMFTPASADEIRAKAREVSGQMKLGKRRQGSDKPT